MSLDIKPLSTALETAQHFIQTVITPPLEQVGSLLADSVKSWRLNNQIAIITKDDENIQEMWSALLANTVEENSKIKTNIFVSTLKEMTTADADVFKVIFEHCTVTTVKETGKHIEHINRALFPDRFGEDPDIDLIFDNLKRLRLIREISTHGSSRLPVVVTDLGLKFMLACS